MAASRLAKIDAFLVFFLFSLVPMTLPVPAGSMAERVLFTGWRWAQVAVLLGAFVYVLAHVVRRGWADRLIIGVLLAGAIVTAASYVRIEWDAQIEYHRVLVLADRYGGLWNGYAHGIPYILGYPPGTSLSAVWYRTIHLPSPNMAQQALIVLWAASFLARYLGDRDGLTKILFFGVMVVMPNVMWHLTFFYNNFFFAIIWAQFILLPLFRVEQRPWEQCAYALLMVWLRPHFMLVMIPIVSGALVRALDGVSLRRLVREVVPYALIAIAVAYAGIKYWQHVIVRLENLQEQHISALKHDLAATQDPQVLHIDVTTRPDPPPPPALISNESAEAIRWAYDITMKSASLSIWFLLGAAFFAVLVLRRGGLAFVVPILSPAAPVIGTAVFARFYPAYTENGWALERMQLVAPILAAGVFAAIHYRLRSAAAR